MLESLLGMFYKLTEEVVHLNKDNADLKGQIKDLGLVTGPNGPSEIESYNNQIGARALPLHAKSYKDAIVN
jgi:hypothetical protein